MAPGRRSRAAPGAGAEGGHGDGEIAEGAEEQPYGDVGGGVVDGSGRVGDVDAVRGAGGDVKLVIAGACCVFYV